MKTRKHPNSGFIWFFYVYIQLWFDLSF